MDHRLPPVRRPDAAPEAHPAVPDPARAPGNAIQAHAGAACQAAPARRPLADRAPAPARRARVRDLPCGHRRLGQSEGAVARGEEARRDRALGARELPETVEGNRAQPAHAAAPHAGSARPAGVTMPGRATAAPSPAAGSPAAIPRTPLAPRGPYARR